MLLVNLFLTRVINQAVMEVQRMITATDPMVMNNEYPRAEKNSVFSIPLKKFLNPKKDWASGSRKVSLVMKAFFLKAFTNTRNKGYRYTTASTIKNSRISPVFPFLGSNPPKLLYFFNFDTIAVPLYFW